MNNIEERIKTEYRDVLENILDHVGRGVTVENVAHPNSKVSHKEIIRVGDHLIATCDKLEIDVPHTLREMLLQLKTEYPNHHK